jgi:hypothetical protein
MQSKYIVQSLGLTQYRCGNGPKHPRFCSACIQEDERTLGFPYFHRKHQLPGVAVCWKHDEILSHGCYICGAYPIPGRGLSMPGRCKCSSELLPMPAFDKLPANHAVLKWLADESAQLVNAVGTTAASSRATLRQLVLNNGFCKGSLLDYCRIATALEQNTVPTPCNGLASRPGQTDVQTPGSVDCCMTIGTTNGEVPRFFSFCS